MGLGPWASFSALVCAVVSMATENLACYSSSSTPDPGSSCAQAMNCNMVIDEIVVTGMDFASSSDCSDGSDEHSSANYALPLNVSTEASINCTVTMKSAGHFEFAIKAPVGRTISLAVLEHEHTTLAATCGSNSCTCIEKDPCCTQLKEGSLCSSSSNALTLNVSWTAEAEDFKLVALAIEERGTTSNPSSLSTKPTQQPTPASVKTHNKKTVIWIIVPVVAVASVLGVISLFLLILKWTHVCSGTSPSSVKATDCPQESTPDNPAGSSCTGPALTSAAHRRVVPQVKPTEGVYNEICEDDYNVLFDNAHPDSARGPSSPTTQPMDAHTYHVLEDPDVVQTGSKVKDPIPNLNLAYAEVDLVQKMKDKEKGVLS